MADDNADVHLQFDDDSSAGLTRYFYRCLFVDRTCPGCGNHQPSISNHQDEDGIWWRLCICSLCGARTQLDHHQDDIEAARNEQP